MGIETNSTPQFECQFARGLRSQRIEASSRRLHVQAPGPIDPAPSP